MSFQAFVLICEEAIKAALSFLNVVITLTDYGSLVYG